MYKVNFRISGFFYVLTMHLPYKPTGIDQFDFDCHVGSEIGGFSCNVEKVRCNPNTVNTEFNVHLSLSAVYDAGNRRDVERVLEIVKMLNSDENKLSNGSKWKHFDKVV